MLICLALYFYEYILSIMQDIAVITFQNMILQPSFYFLYSRYPRYWWRFCFSVVVNKICLDLQQSILGSANVHNQYRAWCMLHGYVINMLKIPKRQNFLWSFYWILAFIKLPCNIDSNILYSLFHLYINNVSIYMLYIQFHFPNLCCNLCNRV